MLFRSEAVHGGEEVHKSIYSRAGLCAKVQLLPDAGKVLPTDLLELCVQFAPLLPPVADRRAALRFAHHSVPPATQSVVPPFIAFLRPA